jgi:hypothetical protein
MLALGSFLCAQAANLIAPGGFFTRSLSLRVATTYPCSGARVDFGIGCGGVGVCARLTEDHRGFYRYRLSTCGLRPLLVSVILEHPGIR